MADGKATTGRVAPRDALRTMESAVTALDVGIELAEALTADPITDEEMERAVARSLVESSWVAPAPDPVRPGVACRGLPPAGKETE